MKTQPYFSGFDSLTHSIEARLIPDAKPQFWASRDCRKEAVVTCVHGFTGTPYEVAPAGKALADVGISAVAPLLPGHGYLARDEQRREFASITKAGMLAAARREIGRARERYEFVGMLGFSMGGAIALTMAAEGLLDACAVVSPALRLPTLGEVLIPLLGWASFTLDAPHSDPFYLPGYDFHHSRALRTLWQLGRHASAQLPNIQCSVLGIHSHNDQTIPPVVLGLMEERIPVPIETAWFDDSDHVMLLDNSGVEVTDTIAEFFRGRLLRRFP